MDKSKIGWIKGVVEEKGEQKERKGDRKEKNKKTT